MSDDKIPELRLEVLRAEDGTPADHMHAVIKMGRLVPEIMGMIGAQATLDLVRQIHAIAAVAKCSLVCEGGGNSHGGYLFFSTHSFDEVSAKRVGQDNSGAKMEAFRVQAEKEFAQKRGEKN